MKNVFYLQFCFLFFTNNVFAQNSSLKLINTRFGYEYSSTRLIKTQDNGYVILDQSPKLDFALMKLNSNWEIEWGKLIGTDANDYLGVIIQTKDGGFFIAGNFSFDFSGYTQIYVIKLDVKGNVQWSKTIVYQTRGLETMCAIQSNDGGYAIAASYATIIKIDSLGNLQWGKTFNSTSSYELRAIVQTHDGGFVATGDAALVIKVDSVGKLIWGKAIGKQLSGDYSRYYNILETPDNGLAIAGSTYYRVVDYHWERYSYVNKLDSNGNLQWSRGFKNLIEGNGLVQLKDSNFIVGGFLEDSSSFDLGFINLNMSGDLLWKKRLPFPDRQEWIGNDNAIIKAPVGYIIYSPLWDADNINHKKKDSLLVDEFYKSDEICNLIPDSTISMVDETANTLVDTLNLTAKESTIIYDVVSSESQFNQKAIATTICSGVLPLYLISFTAQRNGKINVLNWSTSQEINTDYFNIERSDNGIEFLGIGKINAKGNGNIRNNYTFTDNQPLSVINYYRLKIVDKDGQAKYSQIRTINNNISFEVTISPNPIKENITLHFNSNIQMNIEIEVISREGKIFLTKNAIITAGSSTLKMNVIALSNGQYFIKIKSTTEQKVLRLIKAN